MLKNRLKDFNLILSSASPRRQHFFKELDLDFSIDVRPVEETYSSALKREEITNYLAVKKAEPFTDLNPKDILITSDTIVWFNNKPLEKAANKAEATAMISALSDNYHEVITSVCFTTSTSQRVVFDTAKVWFNTLTPEQIEFYIDTYKPYDKAGSYGIQEWLGYIAIPKIEGSFFTVMGLPTHLVYNELYDMGL